jgi:hypothetical protein
MLVASESGEGFAQNYFEALQRDPDVVMAQGEVTKLPGWPGHRPPDAANDATHGETPR